MRDEGDRVAIRFARGCRAFAATAEGGAVVSYGWLSAGREWVGELAIEIAPADGEAYVWNCFTLEPHRRQGHYRRVLQGIVATARSEGLRRLWIGSVEVPAEKADADAGFVRVLRFETSQRGAQRELTARAVEGADESLVRDALRRLGLRRWSHIGPSRARVH